MPLHVIEQVLAPTRAPYINGVRAGLKVSEALRENLYQGLIERDGRGVTQRFTSDAEVNQNAQILVDRIIPVEQDPRELGASVNGGAYNAESFYTQTETVGIELLTVIDAPINIPGSTQRMIRTDLLAKQTQIYGDRLNAIINGATIAAHLDAVWQAQLEGKDVNVVEVSDADVTNKAVAQRFIEANSKLDEGDIEHGIDLFPDDSRVAVFKVSARPLLKAAGVLVIGGANYAYDILKGGAISHDDSATKLDNGYIGDIDGVPCHVASNESLRNADGFLGLPKGTLAGSNFFGYIASSYGTARGVSMVEQIKIVDAIAGQGLILQPYNKIGVKCWYPKGQSVLYRNSEANFYQSVTSLFALTTAPTFKLKARGSRVVPTISKVEIGASNFTATFSDAEKALYVVSTSNVASFADFVSKYNSAAAADKGTCTSGAAVAKTVAAGSYVAVATISSDGSVDFLCKKK